jgi:hypothetical protein
MRPATRRAVCPVRWLPSGLRSARCNQMAAGSYGLKGRLTVQHGGSPLQCGTAGRQKAARARGLRTAHRCRARALGGARRSSAHLPSGPPSELRRSTVQPLSWLDHAASRRRQAPTHGGQRVQRVFDRRSALFRPRSPERPTGAGPHHIMSRSHTFISQSRPGNSMHFGLSHAPIHPPLGPLAPLVQQKPPLQAAGGQNGYKTYKYSM